MQDETTDVKQPEILGLSKRTFSVALIDYRDVTVTVSDGIHDDQLGSAILKEVAMKHGPYDRVEIAQDVIVLPKTEPNDLTVETTTYAGMRIIVAIKRQGIFLAGAVKDSEWKDPRISIWWGPAKVTCAFSPATADEAEVYALALSMAIREARQLDQLYPPGTEGNDLHA